MSTLARALYVPVLALTFYSVAALPQSFPNKAVHVIVPYPPGGMDPIARVITVEASRNLGQPIVIENRAGANGMIGSEYVSRVSPDGYTLLYGSISTHVTPVFLSKGLPYDPVKDFTPISMVADSMFFLTVRSDSGFNSVADLVDFAKRNPGKLAYGSSGPGSIHQLLAEQFKQLAGVDILHVPYRGSAPAQQALVAGEVQLYPGGSSVRPLVQSGRLRHLAVLDTKRFSVFPDVPSINDVLPNHVHIGVWQGFFGPPALPRPILDRLNNDIVKAVKTPAVQMRLTDMGVQPIGDSPEEFAAKLVRNIETVGKIVKAGGIKGEQ